MHTITAMNKDIRKYNAGQDIANKDICDLLYAEIIQEMPEADSKVWHGAPVWFLDGNPIVGYAARKNHVTLLFWSGQSFNEPSLKPEGSFKAAEAHYISPEQISSEDIQRWLEKSRAIQWDYKNIVKRKGVLERLK